MLKIGIVGLGFMGNAHLNACKSIKNIELAGISDIDTKLCEKYSREFNCEYYTDAEELIKREDIDIIDICLPTDLHEKYVVMAAGYGRNILCEKPFTLSLESADRMLEAVNKAGVKFMLAQVVRFWPEYVRMKEIYESNGIGKARVVYANRLAQYPTWNTWMKDTQRSGGGLFDLHSHDIDFLRYLLGPVASVYATGKQSETGAWNHIISVLNFKNGSRACAEGSLEMTDKYPFTMSLRAVGAEGTLEFGFKAGMNIEDTDNAKSSLIYYKIGEEPQTVKVEQKDPYAKELEYFAGCVAENKQPLIIPPAQSREVLSLILAIRKSLETGEVQFIK